MSAYELEITSPLITENKKIVYNNYLFQGFYSSMPKCATEVQKFMEGFEIPLTLNDLSGKEIYKNRTLEYMGELLSLDNVLIAYVRIWKLIVK